MSLTKGANTTVGPVGALESVVLGVAWDSGPLECDVTVLICDQSGKVLGDAYFLFWDNDASPEGAALLRSRPSAPIAGVDRAQLVVDLVGLPESVTRIVVALSTIAEGQNLDSVSNARLRVLDPVAGTEVASYALAEAPQQEACVVLGELYKRGSDWKLRAVGQGYASGLAGLGRDYGVNIVD